MNVQLSAVCHAHQGVAPCTRRQPNRTQGHIRTTMRAAARLLRYCAHPPFAMDRLRKEGAEQRSEPSDKRGTRADELHLAMRRADRSYCRPGAATAYAPAPLLWCAGPEFAAQGCGGGHGCTGVSVTVACLTCTMRHGRGYANSARAGATQARTGALPVGSADRPHLRSFSVAVPEVRWTDAPDRIYYRGHADQADSGSHWGRLRATTQSPGARANAVG